eukprot:CAMPEP_0171650616 /NCGR_PEP_ID=MMETSP0990-20121206/37739_1 /TAXON_ID=483369 /ORGANISM="non described non described, Strain CCMP2098" /LENGTH=283 /DNA_ID=CAMNT_0012229227 /DNA_START=146 /DNA_END=993 /DNA_ORIENTATION=-
MARNRRGLNFFQMAHLAGFFLRDWFRLERGSYFKAKLRLFSELTFPPAIVYVASSFLAVTTHQNLKSTPLTDLIAVLVSLFLQQAVHLGQNTSDGFDEPVKARAAANGFQQHRRRLKPKRNQETGVRGDGGEAQQQHRPEESQTQARHHLLRPHLVAVAVVQKRELHGEENGQDGLQQAGDDPGVVEVLKPQTAFRLDFGGSVKAADDDAEDGLQQAGDDPGVVEVLKPQTAFRLDFGGSVETANNDVRRKPAQTLYGGGAHQSAGLVRLQRGLDLRAVLEGP